MDRPPEFLRRSRLLHEAFAFAREAHREAGEGIDHPVEVAGVLHDHGYGDEVLAAALLHDVVEDTPEGLEAIAQRFGSGVAGLVATMTEDPTVQPYEPRKADHRGRLTAAGGDAAAIFAADKLTKLRELTSERSAVDAPKLEHYRQSLTMLQAAHPEVPFLDRLEDQLAAYERVAIAS